ncbi:MAG: hypothetical protein NTV34_21145, partial [Proteobacteria bacterium]|nr:hypothetical protein [Pseudomonadota bacterium]
NPLKYYNEDEGSRKRIVDVTCKILNKVTVAAAVDILAGMSPPLRTLVLSRGAIAPVISLGFYSKVDPTSLGKWKRP